MTLSGSSLGSSIPEKIRSQFGLSDFYRQYVDVGGFPVVASNRVSQAALEEAAWIVQNMLQERPDLLEALAAARVRLAVMAWNEFTTDLPEHSDLAPKLYWDRRARGLGATPERPAVSCAEENLLSFPGDPYSGENILVHEFAHAIHEMGLSRTDPAFAEKLSQAYGEATGSGLWNGTYAASNPAEYWAEGVQDWFDCNRENDVLHNHVNTRSELVEYDPMLADLCREVFGEFGWTYSTPETRTGRGAGHLSGVDRSRLNRFRWREAPLTDKPRVLLQTEFGEIELELDSSRAPLTTRNFLRYVLEGFYHGGIFHRSVTMQNQPDDRIQIEVVQASANPDRESEIYPPVLLERTSETGLSHLDGTVSMARLKPDTAQHEFFICVGDQPELDFGGKRNPDGQGFAAFGRVVRGIEVVRRIHQSPTEGQSLEPPIRIQRAIRVF